MPKHYRNGLRKSKSLQISRTFLSILTYMDSRIFSLNVIQLILSPVFLACFFAFHLFFSQSFWPVLLPPPVSLASYFSLPSLSSPVTFALLSFTLFHNLSYLLTFSTYLSFSTTLSFSVFTPRSFYFSLYHILSLPLSSPPLYLSLVLLR